MKIYIENENLKATKSCSICTHVDICKFYSKAKELFKSNEFYEMTEYLESNNNLTSWSENKSCQYYLPFIFDKKLFELELKKKKSFINAYQGWFDLAHEYFLIKYYQNHLDYFKIAFEKAREKSFHVNEPDEKLVKFCVKRSISGEKIFTYKGNNDEWSYEFSLLEVLEYFNAFKDIS